VCSATGGYGWAGVQVAIAMGARVIAMGRNETKLAELKSHMLQASPGAQIEMMNMTGDEADDLAELKAFGTIDAVLDLTPPQASRVVTLEKCHEHSSSQWPSQSYGLCGAAGGTVDFCRKEYYGQGKADVWARRHSTVREDVGRTFVSSRWGHCGHEAISAGELEGWARCCSRTSWDWKARGVHSVDTFSNLSLYRILRLVNANSFNLQ
jgi:hypothetical protein